MKKGQFGRVWVLMFVLAVFSLLVHYAVFAQTNPSFKDILAKQEVASSSFDPSLIIASTLALALVGMSLAKGFEVFKQNKTDQAVALCDEIITEEQVVEDREVEELRKGIKELRQVISEIEESKFAMQQENNQLEKQIDNLNCEIEKMNAVDRILRKSNISLSKECERLKAQNEDLTLKKQFAKLPAKKNKTMIAKTRKKTASKASKIKTASKPKVKAKKTTTVKKKKVKKKKK